MSRTTEYLQTKGIAYEVLEHAPAFTGVAEARALHLDPHIVVKTLLLDSKWGHALAVIPADRRLDMRMVADAVGDQHVHLATEPEIEHDYPGFELGCLPPLGALLETPLFVDGDIMRHQEVVFAGDQTAALRAPTQEVFADERVTVTRLSRGDADAYV